MRPDRSVSRRLPFGFRYLPYFALLLAFSLGAAKAGAQTCPPSIGMGSICNANDFQVTSVVVSGPEECTLGETFSITLNIGLNSTAPAAI